MCIRDRSYIRSSKDSPVQEKKVEVPKELSPKKELKPKKEVKKEEKAKPKQENIAPTETIEKSKKSVNINGSIRVNDLARKIGKRGNEVVKKLVELGEMASLNDEVDQETAVLVSEEFGFIVKFEEEQKLTEEVTDYPKIESNYIDVKNPQNRHSVVTVMGHVDPVSYTHLTLPTILRV